MTTNNHPAHGPVSLERLHQIRETLSKAAAQSDGGNLGYAMADAVKVIDGAIAARNTEPVTLPDYMAKISKPTLANILADDDEAPMACAARLLAVEVGFWRSAPLYTTPPAPIVPDEITSTSAPEVFEIAEEAERLGFRGTYASYAVGWNACRAAMLQSLGNSEQLDEIGSWNNHRNTPTAKPAIDTGELLKSIEGMEVSVDVSTCDADAGNRYFGTVSEISELDTAKNGYILLVQDAKPNFKQTGNSPVIPDGWIPVSERMPERDVDVQVYCADKKEQMVGYMERNEAEGWFRFASLPNGGGVYCKPTHWMPLQSAPRQEVKSALEHGMQRYSQAMQKLSEGDK